MGPLRWPATAAPLDAASYPEYSRANSAGSQVDRLRDAEPVGVPGARFGRGLLRGTTRGGGLRLKLEGEQGLRVKLGGEQDLRFKLEGEQGLRCKSEYPRRTDREPQVRG